MHPDRQSEQNKAYGVPNNKTTTQSYTNICFCLYVVVMNFQHLVYEYARHGACVALVARTEVALRAVAKAARDLGAPDVLVVPADVTKVDDAKRAVEETVAHFGKRT
jgi:hypothetical protein